MIGRWRRWVYQLITFHYPSLLLDAEAGLAVNWGLTVSPDRKPVSGERGAE